MYQMALKHCWNFNRLSRVHERYRRQTDQRQRPGRSTLPPRLLSCCTDDYAHTYAIFTYSVSNDCVSDSSSELRCLASPYMNTHHTYIHATCKRHVEKGLTQTTNSVAYTRYSPIRVKTFGLPCKLTLCRWSVDTVSIWWGVQGHLSTQPKFPLAADVIVINQPVIYKAHKSAFYRCKFGLKNLRNRFVTSVWVE